MSFCCTRKSKWNQCTTMEGYLTVVSVAAICMVIVMSIVLAFIVTTFKRPQASTCFTPGCIHAASLMLRNMDFNVEPCEDFYNFACGSYIKDTIIPDYKLSVDQFSQVTDKLQNQLKGIIAEPVNDDDSEPYLLVKELYAACMNERLIEERGLDPMKKILKDMGGWPVLEGDAWDSDEYSWRDSIYNFRKYGYSTDYFMEFSVTTDYKNSTLRKIGIGRTPLESECPNLLKGINNPMVSAYYQYQLEVAVIMGADRERAAKEIQESIQFEIKLKNISMAYDDHNISYHTMTVETLQTMFPSIPWLEYINNLLPSSVQVDNNEVIMVESPSFIEELEEILNTTPSRVMVNYAMTQAMLSSVTYLTNKLRNEQLKYYMIKLGIIEREPRWKECIDMVTEKLSLAVGSLYVQKYFKDYPKEDILEIVQDIRHEFYKILKSVDWMDEETRKHGLEKANAMTVHIAYADELLKVDKLEEYYELLDINEEFYLESVLTVDKFTTEYLLGQLRQTVNKTDWVTYGNTVNVNAEYHVDLNSIEIPAGILQGHVYDSEHPQYMNYGALGYCIGHELTHGFDEELRGEATLNENIADNGGIKEAYRAYLAWTRRHGEEPSLPGLEYSPRQLFWISAAQTWCSKTRPEFLKLEIRTDTHAPDEFRVLGPFSNLKEFSADFSCPKGSKMNPVKKCSVW